MRALAATLVLCSVVGSAAWADQALEPADWLSRMGRSHRELNYHGIVTFQVGEQLNSFKVSHVVRQGMEFERLEALEGQADETQRQGHALNCVHRGAKLVEMLAHNAGNEGLRRYYSIEFEGAHRQAGRPVMQVLVRPKDVYRYGYRLALDTESGLLLRSDILNQQGRTIERFQYVMLELGAPAAQTSDNDPALSHTHTLTPHSSVSASANPLPWKPTLIPTGFEPVELAVADANSRSYTDGLAVLSVFVEPLTEEQPKVDTSMRRGASVSYSVAFPSQNSLVTVVGEVPMVTAREVARSISWDE